MAFERILTGYRYWLMITRKGKLIGLDNVLAQSNDLKRIRARARKESKNFTGLYIMDYRPDGGGNPKRVPIED